MTLIGAQLPVRRLLKSIDMYTVAKGKPFNYSAAYLFLVQKRKLRLINRIQKQIDKFALTTDDLQIGKL